MSRLPPGTILGYYVKLSPEGLVTYNIGDTYTCTLFIDIPEPYRPVFSNILRQAGLRVSDTPKVHKTPPWFSDDLVPI